MGTVDYRLLERFVSAQQENAFRRLLTEALAEQRASRRRPDPARPVA